MKIVLVLLLMILSLFSDVKHSLIPYRVDDKWGFCDQRNKVIVPPIYDKVSLFSDGMAKVGLGSRYGYVNSGGKLVIPAIYAHASDFVRGTALVRDASDHFMLIDDNGTVVKNLPYEFVGLTTSNDIWISTKNKSGLLDRKGNIIMPLNDLFRYEDASEGAIIALEEASFLVGYIDYHGKNITPFVYHRASPFHGGYAVCGYKDSKHNDHLGVIDANGSVVIPYEYQDIRFTGDSVFGVKKNNKWGYVNLKNETVIDRNGRESCVDTQQSAFNESKSINIPKKKISNIIQKKSPDSKIIDFNNSILLRMVE